MPFNARTGPRPSRKASHERNLSPWLVMASDDRRAPDECEVPPLDIGVRAIQLSPYRAGVAGRHHTRLLLPPAFQPCSCPLALSGRGQAVASESLCLELRPPPGAIRSVRTAAHDFSSSGSSPQPVERRSADALADIVPFATTALPSHRGSVDMHMSISYLRVHCWLRWAFGPFSGTSHRLTSPKVRTFHVPSTVRTKRKSAPFRVGYARLCGPIRPVTGRHSLFPSSPTLCSIPLPYGWDTTYVGSIGLTQLSMKKDVSGTVGVCTPVGVLDVAASSAMKRSCPRTFWLWPVSLFGHSSFTRF